MADNAIRLRASDVVLADGRKPFSEDVKAGEIVGLAGLDGHGQEAFVEALAGLRAPRAGNLTTYVDGQPREVTSFRAAVANGIAYLPRDRRATGIFPTMSILDNFAISTVWRDCAGGFINARKRRQRYESYKERLSIVAPRPGKPITALSGGNQQKVLLARALALEPNVLLLNDPTRGVDIATRHVLYDVFRDLASKGMALVILSTEIEEALVLCSRILVFREHDLAVRLEGSALSSDNIIAGMFGRATEAA
jgi:ribose transport system ATP-binding protein